MTKYKYGYLLLISNDESFTSKYDYMLTNYELFNNTAVYDKLSGMELCRYDLYKKEDNEDFFDRINECEDMLVERIDILFDLALMIDEFMEVE